MTRQRLLWLASVVVLAASFAVALLDAPGGMAGSQQRVDHLAAEVRCPTCNGLSVAESEAPLAQSAKAEIATQVGAGRTDAEVRDYFVGRYGPSALMTPPRSGLTWLAWLLPIAAVVGGITVVVMAVRAWRLRGRPAQRTGPSAEDRRLVEAALREGS
jgi:cytochrome c-type biogenesis protein CcmH